MAVVFIDDEATDIIWEGNTFQLHVDVLGCCNAVNLLTLGGAEGLGIEAVGDVAVVVAIANKGR